MLLLHLVHELAPKDVAEALARSDATVRTQLARGLDLLRKALPVGFAGLAAGQVPAPVGLAAMRASVLAHAGAAAAGAAATMGATVIAFSGVVVTKKVVLAVAVVLLALVGSWPWWGGASAPRANAETSAKAMAVVEQQESLVPPVSSPATAQAETDRVAAPEPVERQTTGGLCAPACSRRVVPGRRRCA